MSSIYSQQALSFLQELIQTPSVNGVHNEDKVIKLIIEKCDELGLPHKVYEKEKGRPNLFIGEGFSNPDSVLFVAHSDTVHVGQEGLRRYGPFSGTVADGKIYGRGAIDCKGGIATSIYALKLLGDIGLSRTAKIIIGVDEENGPDSEFGIKYVLDEGLHGSGAVYTYGGKRDPYKLNIGHRGLLRIRVICTGEDAHVGSKEWQQRIEGANAISGLLSFIQELQSLPFFKETNDFFPGYTFGITPTLITGGEGESIVPGYAKMMLDIRTLPGQTTEKIMTGLKEIAQKLQQSKLSFSFEIKNAIPAVISDTESPFVQNFVGLISKRFGVAESDIVLKGSGPANESHLLIERGIPTVAGFGPSGSGFHAVDEYAEIDAIPESIRLLSDIAKAMR